MEGLFIAWLCCVVATLLHSVWRLHAPRPDRTTVPATAASRHELEPSPSAPYADRREEPSVVAY